MSEQDVLDIRAAGPDLVEFVSEFCDIIVQDMDEAPDKHSFAREIAEAYVDDTVSRKTPEHIRKEVYQSVLPEIQEYFGII